MHPLLKRIEHSPEINKLLLDSIDNSDYQCTAISFVNPFSYQILRSNKTSYLDIDHFYSDAMLSSYIFGKLFNKNIPRVSFDYGSFAKTFFEVAELHDLPIFIVGSKKEQLKGAITQFKKSYPKLNICGSHDGYFESHMEIIDLIKISKAQYVICGLGTPKQDEFAQSIKRALPHQVKQVYTCGGFIHQSETRVDYYPNFINQYNLRWLYRAIKEPKVIKRLLVSYPLFTLYVLFDRIKD
jgi:N-acetylglucosaminyldiphosphoundecaprenol N-acetyl-beta-D-mannosaminyltransferase